MLTRQFYAFRKLFSINLSKKVHLNFSSTPSMIITSGPYCYPPNPDNEKRDKHLLELWNQLEPEKCDDEDEDSYIDENDETEKNLDDPNIIAFQVGPRVN
uniref:Uncharacterized protein n=1 Tax=Panagrolaimus sp. JU765 TaxID=591449 RepID=A0AC34RRH4_9BILA